MSTEPSTPGTRLRALHVQLPHLEHRLADAPGLHRVFFTKLLLVSGLILVLGVLATVGMFLVGQAVLGATGCR